MITNDSRLRVGVGRPHGNAIGLGVFVLARRNPKGGFIISAGEVGAFTVCPQSWHLLWNNRAKQQRGEDRSVSNSRGELLHAEWSGFFEESLELSKLIRYLAVLICIVSVFFIFLVADHEPLSRIFELSFSSRGFQVTLLIAVAFWLARLFRKEAAKKHHQAGFQESEVALAIDGSSILPEREYVSESLGLAGRPDAIIREEGFVIPIECKPLAKKLRDRYVAQLLVYMKLVEECEGKRPPHGYLFLGQKYRRIKIINSEERQIWLDTMVADMRQILEGEAPKPSPHPKKCSRCAAKHRCSSRMDT